MKKLFTLVLVVFSISCLVGCGGGGGSDNNSSWILGSWKHIKESNPFNYSQLVEIKPNSSGKVSTMTFYSNGQIKTVDYTITYISKPVLSPADPVDNSWKTEDETPDTDTFSWHLSGSTLTLSDGKNTSEFQVVCEGATMTITDSESTISVYKKAE